MKNLTTFRKEKNLFNESHGLEREVVSARDAVAAHKEAGVLVAREVEHAQGADLVLKNLRGRIAVQQLQYQSTLGGIERNLQKVVCVCGKSDRRFRPIQLSSCGPYSRRACTISVAPIAPQSDGLTLRRRVDEVVCLKPLHRARPKRIPCFAVHHGSRVRKDGDGLCGSADLVLVDLQRVSHTLKASQALPAKALHPLSQQRSRTTTTVPEAHHQD